jgi:hypothetical protein
MKAGSRPQYFNGNDFTGWIPDLGTFRRRFFHVLETVSAADLNDFGESPKVDVHRVE